MKVTYSGKMDIGGGGIGTTAYHQVKPLLENDLIETIYSPSIKKLSKEKWKETPSVNAPYVIQDIFFDGWCAIHMKYPEILQTWGSHCLFQLREFPKAISIVNLFSAHPLEAFKILKDEMQTNPVDPDLMIKQRKELEICDHIVIPSEWVLQSLRKHGLDHKAKLIPFGVNLEEFTPRSKPREDDVFRVIYVGNAFIRKGLIYLLTAWKMLDLKNAELIIGGVGEDIKEIFDYKSNNVKWGWIQDLAEAYRNSDIFVLPTLEDGCPLVTYEAMASGIPVIITENCGTAQHIYNGTNGFVIPIRDVKIIAEYLQYFYDNREEARKMGRNARKMAEAFPWERHESEYLKFIQSLF